ncbi:ADP-ribosylation factor-like protein 2-binding protein [Parambassis ranga]|uniref:ADP-ribosylation factor-like protein 2-binding protein n=1 Tax=Parambassis ranga TaxID=210632 RepID=A0A6P7IHD3_9TELE|nr:ADP-ribosylation factor-like protein 2-binding protein [Parambassis ranga]
MALQERDVQSCPENFVEIVETDEDDFAISSYSPEVTAFDSVIDCISTIVIDSGFQQLQQSFMQKYYLEFEDSDENKLSYTLIFHEYVELLEKYLEEQLMEKIPGFNMDNFLDTLMQRKDEVPEDIVELLLSFTDFMAFKEMFLNFRAGQDLDLDLHLEQALKVTSLTPARQRP